MTREIACFTINRDDIVIDADQGWTEFALENQGSGHLCHPIGRSLWDLITDPSVRQLYAMLLKALRTRSARRAAYPFRCDSPFQKRHMRMVVEAEQDGRVRFTSYLDSCEENTIKQFTEQQARQLPLRVSVQKEAVFFDGGWTDIVHALCGAEIFRETVNFTLLQSD